MKDVCMNCGREIDRVYNGGSRKEYFSKQLCDCCEDYEGRVVLENEWNRGMDEEVDIWSEEKVEVYKALKECGFGFKKK